MRFMMIMYPGAAPESRRHAGPQTIAAMMKYNEDPP
jgi:hypothetical protein